MLTFAFKFYARIMSRFYFCLTERFRNVVPLRLNKSFCLKE